MPMIECFLCGKGFVSAGPKVCPSCMKRLDKLYMDARNYIRDNPDLRLNVKALAEELDVDPRDIQALVDMERLELESESESSDRLSERERLLLEFEKHLKDGKGKDKESRRIRYAAEKYGKQEKKRKIESCHRIA